MKTQSIYKSPEGEKTILAFYDSVLARWPVSNEKLNISTRHGDTFVIASGDEAAPPLVLLHGSSTNSAIWSSDVVEYSRHYRVYAVDTLGEPGHSAPNRPSLKSLAHAEWLADVFGAVNIEKAAFIGYSQGGWMALRFATIYPEQIEKLVLLTPGGVTNVRLSTVLRLIAVSMFGRRGMQSINRLVYGDLAIPEEVEAFSTLIMNHYKPRTDAQPLFSDEELKQLIMPTLLVAGAKDCFYVSEKTAARLQTLLPDFQANILPDTGHVLLNTPTQIIPFLTSNR